MNDTTATTCTCPSGDGSLRHPCPIHTIQRAQAQPAAAQEAVEDASNIIELLLTLAYAAWSLADNADGGSGNDNVSVDRRDFDKVSEALDALDELPDDQPGYVMEAAAKARWALRGILASPVAAAPVAPVDSDAFAYLVDEIAAEHGEMLDDGGPSGWSFTCEDLVAFAKRLMSDYKGVLVADAYAIARAEAKRDSTPAPPGIDLTPFREAVLAQHAALMYSWCGDPETKEAADKQRDQLLTLIDASPKGGSEALQIPDTEGVREILGRMCFQCIRLAQVLRLRGDEIKGRAEDEQAAVLRFLLNHYLAAPEKWAEHAQAEIDAIRKQATSAEVGA